MTATDPDLGDTLTYSLVNNAGGRFAINATTGEITVANGSKLDYEANTSHTVTVRVSDGSLSSQTVLTIDVNDVNEAPGAAGFTGGSAVNENSANGTVVGTVIASDPDLGDTVTYSLSNDAGGRFAIIATPASSRWPTAAYSISKPTPATALRSWRATAPSPRRRRSPSP